MRILLRVAYDGTSYCGWQRQPEQITVEEVVNRAATELFGQEISIIGASRTDSGVHAMGNVAVFDVDTRIPAEKISYALNSRLPEDVRIVESKEVPGDFHPRHTNCIKTYKYTIWNDTFENPVKRLYSHFFYGSLDVDCMNQAAKEFIGSHDFTAFCSAKTEKEDKVREIYEAKVEQNGHEIVITVTGNGFLYNMVRIIAGTLIKVGAGVIRPEEIPAIIGSKDRNNAGPTAPAKGLRLEKIVYEELGE